MFTYLQLLWCEHKKIHQHTCYRVICIYSIKKKDGYCDDVAVSMQNCKICTSSTLREGRIVYVIECYPETILKRKQPLIIIH